MAKLQFKDLAPYLPYGLRLINIKSGKTTSLRGLIDGIGSFTIISTIKDGNSFRNHEFESDLWPIKPILKPLSCLDKEAWIKILIEGLRQANPPHTTFIGNNVSIEFTDDLGVEIITDIGINISYDFRGKTFEGNGVRFNQLAVFEELYKNHVDINFLIDQNLAIDINTINQ